MPSFAAPRRAFCRTGNNQKATPTGGSASLNGGPWLMNAGTVTVYLDARTDAYVAAGTLQLVPVNNVQIVTRPSFIDTTAESSVTVTTNVSAN